MSGAGTGRATAIRAARRAALAALAVLPTSAWAADFGRETWCEGDFYFSNDDGTAEIYDLRLWYHGGQYVLVSHDLETGDVFEDRGTCDLAVDDICKHYISEEDENTGKTVNDAYAFRLTPLEGGRFLYHEMWLDGSHGRGMVACFSAE